jgi:hypothetical protein
MRNILRVIIIGVALFTAACAQPSTNTPLPYSDDFANPTGGWQTLSDISANVKYDGGKLRFIINQENLTQWSVAGKVFQDGSLTVEAKSNGGPTDNGFGVLFRVKDRRNFYHFEISSDGYWRAGVMKDGNWDNWDDWAASNAVIAGQATQKLKVTMKANKFSYFINDQKVFEKTDDSFTTGDIGLFALTLIDNPGTDISFDNVSVTAVDR